MRPGIGLPRPSPPRPLAPRPLAPLGSRLSLPAPRSSPLPSPAAPKPLLLQAQAADIGLMGGPAKKWSEAEGKMKAVPGCQIFIGGTIGATEPTLSLMITPTLSRHRRPCPSFLPSPSPPHSPSPNLAEPIPPHSTLTQPSPNPHLTLTQSFQAVCAPCRLITPIASPRLPCGPRPHPPSPPAPRPPAGEDGELAMDAAVKGIPLDSDDLIPVLTEIAVKHFHGTVNAEFVADQAAWEKACPRHAPRSSPRPPHAFLVISR